MSYIHTHAEYCIDTFSSEYDIIQYSHWSHARLTVLGRVVAKQGNTFKSVRFSGLGSWASSLQNRVSRAHILHEEHMMSLNNKTHDVLPRRSSRILGVFAQDPEYLLTLKNIC